MVVKKNDDLEYKEDSFQKDNKAPSPSLGGEKKIGSVGRNNTTINKSQVSQKDLETFDESNSKAQQEEDSF